MSKKITISVRNIVELVMRGGDIDSGYLSARRAQDGTRIHQQIQRRRKREAKLDGVSYESEVPMKIDFDYREFTFHIEGRADGVFTTDAGGGFCVGIEEIKSTSRPVDSIIAPETHWAQAKMYAHMYCAANFEHGIETIGVQLTYCNYETEETAEVVNTFGADELREYFFGIIERYYEFARLEDRCLSERLETARAVEFPYAAYRAGQRELAAAVYKTVTGKRALFAQAPTGTGKTISALFPAVKALGQDKIFYLTAKTVTRGVAAEALEIMQRHGLKMRSVVLTAKEKICFAEGRCNPNDCEYAAGHFDRVNAALIDIITNETMIRRGQVEAYARKFKICPFEFSLDICNFCDCVICDYNHVYDPKVQLRRFFGGDARNEHILLNDEAHNLVERAREMFSAGLNRGDFGIRSMFRGSNNKKLYSTLGRIRDWFKGIEGMTLSYDLPTELILRLRDFVPYADIWLAENAAHPKHTEFLELYFRVLDFLRISDFFDERYVILLNDGREPSIRLLCLDPSFLLAQTHRKTRAAIFFSATLTPLKYFRDVFGGTGDDYGIRLPSPFPRENLCLAVAQIDTTYKNRQNSIPSVAEYVYELVGSRSAGNYLIFFSSYEYMNSVHAYFVEAYPDITVIPQTQGMGEDEKEAFLTRFVPEPDGILAGFVVMGGIFSEGIDLVGERLCGVAVVGVGLPTISVERNVLSDYYKDRLGKGFEYAYMYPGMNKVLQAAGRLIRSETDRGAVLLIDSRFAREDYRQLFPDEWAHWVNAKSAAGLGGVLGEFWEGSGGVLE
ncbi:MAG: ATP-dependent DNA helicase [Defluviitaleaceae bacterium]|nr:ATP-dependent DNA helicase [Defluviitaleaceae bacterium]